jgi:hypothetical protein
LAAPASLHLKLPASLNFLSLAASASLRYFKSKALDLPKTNFIHFGIPTLSYSGKSNEAMNIPMKPIGLLDGTS